MKTPSDELFHLIKSLSGQEKRAFKLFPQQKSAPLACLKLFDAIDSLKRYDEKKLLAILKKTGGINYLKQAKRHLYEIILRFLEYHYFDSSVEIQLCRQLQRIEILVSKRLFVSARKCITKAEKMAVENHQYLDLLKISDWKQKITIRKSDYAELDAYKHTHYLKELQYIGLYKNMAEYRKINNEVNVFLMGRSTDIDERAIIELNEILKNPFLQNETMALSFPAKFAYFRILGDIHFLLKNREIAHTCYQRSVNYFELAKLPPNIRLQAFSKLIISSNELKKSEEVLLIKNDAVNFFKSLPKKSQTTNLYTQYILLMNNYIASQLSVLNTREALAASDEIEELMEKNPNALSFVVYYSNLAELFFLTGNYRRALRSANKVLDKEKTGLRPDIISGVKILSLVIHYELGNEDMLPNLGQSYHRYPHKQKHQSKAEQILLNFFGKTIHANPAKKRTRPDKEDRIQALMGLKKELEICKTGNIFGQFDFISWAESKIQNRPMIEIMKEKLK